MKEGEAVTSRRDCRLWYVYDFANSIMMVSVMYYFSLWVVVDNNLSQWIVSLPVSLSTVLLILLMPAIARRVDRNGTHKKMMILFSLGAALALLFFAFLKPSLYLPYHIFITYFLFYFCYQSGYVFFTSFINEISDRGNRVRISGFGQLWGQSGNLAGVLISFATIHFTLLGIIGKQQVFLWAALLFMLFLIPLYWFRKGAPLVAAHRQTAVHSLNASTLKKIYSNKKIFWFLIMYVVYADAMITVSFFITLYMTKGPGLTVEMIKLAAFSMLLGTMLGGLLTAYMHKRDPLQVIKKLLVIFSILLALLSMLRNSIFIVVLMFFMGMVLSMIFAISRSYYSTLIPTEQRAEYFSIYVIFERLGAIVGPIIWSMVIFLFMFLGEGLAYRIAMFSLAAITICSVFFIRKIQRLQ